MSIVRTDITLKNALDVGYAANGDIKSESIREAAVSAVVDTGAWTLVISEDLRNQLGLRKTGRRYGTLANGQRNEYDLAGPIEVIWHDRSTICETLVLPNAKEVLLGALPLEAMDLMVHPSKEEVVGAHGDEASYCIYGV